MASTPTYINPASGAHGALTLSTSFQTIATGQTGGSFLSKCIVYNSQATIRTLTFADESDNIICTVNLNASAGNTIDLKALDVLDTKELAGTCGTAYGDRVYRLRSSQALKVKVDSISGAAAVIHWDRIDN